ncbi:site-spific DNA-methyltransferase (adenine-spific) [Jeotgalibacillus alimentarius]|uniref:site-specific DNA-methyltransferase (adenine-specific) n=1 Tax=Jeotgalibacillus alimentarius TaxID=135826 RepID=A0A0C2RM29_9BACL|nr:Dam family site-specific DNA-(adenine-N6)-methyltransferase [Jeotgalibacillus alimentarius]KIL42834.1 site-spific DNA-methyltransferase (adenine-spific) [Jeotgalibacillus alimentarius]
MHSLINLEVNKVYLEDCLEGMKKIQDNTVDIVIADPPYNLSKGGSWSWNNSVKLPGLGGQWNKVMQEWDDMPITEYFSFTLQWLTEVKRIVKPTGSIWIHGTYHNIGIINFALQMLEVEIINEVIWFKRNSFPNLSGRRLTASHETILWSHTGGPKNREYHFNYEMSKNHDYEGDLIKQPFKQMRTVWDIPNNKKKEELMFGKHPTQKTEKVVDRMIRISAKPGDLLLSPFSGAGTECVVAKKLGLNYIGFETEEEFLEISNKRLNNIEFGQMEMKEFSEVSSKKKNDKNKNFNEDNISNDSKIDSPEIEIEKEAHQLNLELPETEIESNTIENVINNKSESSIDIKNITDIPVLQSILNENKKKQPIPSILKWTGSKRKQANQIFNHFPKEYNRYIEPFVGGGALLYLAADDNSIANDIYKPLIEFWELVKNKPDYLVDYYNREWINLQQSFPDYYYDVRDRFNKNPNGLDLSFLTRTCVNGIVRFNKEGGFNNSIHLSRKGMKPQNFQSIVYKWHKKIKNVTFTNKDYREILKETKSGDLVYLDPPYAGSNNRYISDLDIDSFFEELEKLNTKGVKWILSFDGKRGDTDLQYPVPEELYLNKELLSNGKSTLNQVLNGQSLDVLETLYKNY